MNTALETCLKSFLMTDFEKSREETHNEVPCSGFSEEPPVDDLTSETTTNGLIKAPAECKGKSMSID